MGRMSQQNPYTFTITDNTSVTAVFVPTGGGTVTSTHSINPNVYLDGNLVRGWNDYVNIVPGLSVGHGEDVTLSVAVKNTLAH